MMYYYADDLTEMLVDDILADTVKELQQIEEKERSNQAVNEGQQLAQNLLKHVVDYQSEQHLVQVRWTNAEALKRHKRGQMKPAIDISGGTDNYYELDPTAKRKGGKVKDAELGESSQSNSGLQQQYANPFDPKSAAAS